MDNFDFKKMLETVEQLDPEKQEELQSRLKGVQLQRELAEMTDDLSTSVEFIISNGTVDSLEDLVVIVCAFNKKVGDLASGVRIASRSNS